MSGGRNYRRNQDRERFRKMQLEDYDLAFERTRREVARPRSPLHPRSTLRGANRKSYNESRAEEFRRRQLQQMEDDFARAISQKFVSWSTIPFIGEATVRSKLNLKSNNLNRIHTCNRLWNARFFLYNLFI